MKRYRIENIADSYNKVLKDKSSVAYGDQILYEMEKDLKAMRWALEYMDEFLKANKRQNTNPPGIDLIRMAFKDLLKRVSEYSCPMNQKDEYKTKEKCYLGEKCMCLSKTDPDSHICGGVSYNTKHVTTLPYLRSSD